MAAGAAWLLHVTQDTRPRQPGAHASGRHWTRGAGLKAGRVDPSPGRSALCRAGSQVVYRALIQVYTKPFWPGLGFPVKYELLAKNNRGGAGPGGVLGKWGCQPPKLGGAASVPQAPSGHLQSRSRGRVTGRAGNGHPPRQPFRAEPHPRGPSPSLRPPNSAGGVVRVTCPSVAPVGPLPNGRWGAAPTF